MRADEEERTLQFLSQFKTEPVDQALVDEAGVLFRKWNPGHGIDVNDARPAAGAKRAGGMIFSLNRQRYPMPDIPIKRSWTP